MLTPEPTVIAGARDPAEPSERPNRDWLTAGRFSLFLAGLIFFAFPAVLLGMRTFVFRDFGLFSYPVASFARDCLLRGELPLWNPFSNCGLPFLAQWNTMVLYPPALLYVLLPLTWALPCFCVLHVFWGGLGMFYLAREWSRIPWAAGLAGVVFAFNGLTLNFLMWPSHVATFSWFPWVIWLGQKGLRAGGRKLAMAICVAALQMLAGGPETIVVTWVLLALIAAVDWWEGGVPLPRVASRLASMAAAVAVISAAQLLPFLELVVHSQRDSGYGAVARGWSMPIWGWANLLVPLFRTTPTAQGVYFQNQQYWTSSYYAGVGTVWLVLVAVWRSRQLRVRLLAAFVLVALMLAVGDAGGVYHVVRSILPALDMVRYPVKFIIAVLAVAPLLGAFGFAALCGVRPKLQPFEFASASLLLGLTGLTLYVARTASPESWTVTWHNGFTRAVFLVVEVISVTVCAGQLSKIRAPNRSALIPILAGSSLLVVFYLDLLTHVPNQNPTASPTVYSAGLTRLQHGWNPGPTLGVSRVFVSPEAQEALKYKAISDAENNYLLQRVGLLADCNLIDQVPQVHGFFSLTPGEINDVTVAPYVQTNRDFSSLLDFMGASQVINASFDAIPRPTASPLVTIGQECRFAEDAVIFQAFSQTNTDLKRVVFLPSAAQQRITAKADPEARATDASFERERLSFHTRSQRPTIAVVSQTYYPAWKAWLDGKPVRLWRANYAFQAVEVPAGEHRIELRYQDRMFWFGALLSGLGIVATAGLWRFSARG